MDKTGMQIRNRTPADNSNAKLYQNAAYWLFLQVCLVLDNSFLMY